MIGSCIGPPCGSVRWHIWTSRTISARNSPSGAGAESSSRGQWVRKPAFPVWQMTEPQRRMYTALAKALHYEFKPLGVYVTVLAAGFTNTAVLEKFGLDPKTMPMKPMSVEQCVSEGLRGLVKNRSRVVPGRLNRILNALVPASLARKMEADLLGKGLASKPAPANARAEA